MEVPLGHTTVSHVGKTVVDVLVRAVDVANTEDTSQVDDTASQATLAATFGHRYHEAVAGGIW